VGQPGSSYTIETAETLGQWESWTNAVNFSGRIEFEKSTDESPRSFFRARRNP
jgi:hypothetical protein